MPKAPDGTTRGTVGWREGGQSFAMIPEWMLYGPFTDRAVRVYGVLARFADSEGRAFPGKPRICELIGCARSTLDAAMKELEEGGALEVVARYRRDGGRTSNDYVLGWAPPGGRGTPPESSGAPHPRVVGGQELEPVQERKPGTRTTSGAGAPQESERPKFPRVDGRDLALDALAEICEIDPANRTRMREAATALKGSKRPPLQGIEELFWIEYQRWTEAHSDKLGEWTHPSEWDPEALTRALEQAVRLKASLYRQVHPDWELTPNALRKYWLDLKPRPGAGVSGDDLRKGRA